MRYRNPRLPRIDASESQQGEHRELLRLLVSVSAIVLLLIFALDRLAYWAAPRLPFAWEVEIAQSLSLDTLPVALLKSRSVASQGDVARIEAALQQRAERISQALPLPEGMKVKVHYDTSPVVNAVATMGGNVTVFRGLLDKLEYEEELDAVLAHEIGHVMHRHMVRHLSRGLSMAAALSLAGIRSASLNRWLVGDAQQLQQLAYSRAAEREADETAALAVNRLHGHTGGMVRLFERFGELRRKQGGVAQVNLPFLESHPGSDERAGTARNASSAKERPLTPLDAIYRPEKTEKPPVKAAG